MPTSLKKSLLLFCISLLIISCKEEKLVVTKISTKTIAVDTTIQSNKSYSKVISPYKQKMITEINTKISFTLTDLTRNDGDLESSLGNLLADLSYERANPVFNKLTGKNIDFAMFNYGGIRAGITAGDVTNKNAFELMPFENMLVVVELNGKQMVDLISYLEKRNTAHPVSKHFRLTLNKNNYTLNIKTKKFDKEKTYYVLTSDYLQSGGDNMVFFKNPLQRISLEYKLRDAIVDYFKSVDTIKSKLDGRFKRE